MKIMNDDVRLFISAYRLLCCCVIVIAIGQISNTQNISKVSPQMEYIHSVVWLSETKNVYFLNSEHGTNINRYQPDNQDFVTAKIEASDTDIIMHMAPVSAAATTFVVGKFDQLGMFSWDGIGTTPIKIEKIPITLKSGEIVSCLKGDSEGRLWIGISYSVMVNDTAATLRGKLIMFTGGASTMKLDNIDVPHGIAWSPLNTGIYIITETAILGGSFNSGSGDIDLKSDDLIFDLTDCVPQDMTVGRDGNLWVACNAMPQVIQIDPKNRTSIKTIDIKSGSRITSVVFGGIDFEDLYVTAIESGLFRVTNVGSKGMKANAVIISPPA